MSLADSHNENDLFAIEKIEFYQLNTVLLWVWRVLCVVSLGLVPLIDYRYLGSRLSLRVTHKKLAQLDEKELLSMNAYYAKDFSRGVLCQCDKYMVRWKHSGQSTVLPLRSMHFGDLKRHSLDPQELGIYVNTVSYNAVDMDDGKEYELAPAAHEFYRGVAATKSGTPSPKNYYYYFEFFKCKFFFDDHNGRFRRAQLGVNGVPVDEIYTRFGARLLDRPQTDTRENVNERRREITMSVFGPNSLDIHIKNPLLMFLDQVLHPFYLFYLFSVIFWYFDQYYAYATVIWILSVISAVVNVVSTRSNMVRIRQMAKFETDVTRIKDFKSKEQISSTALLPGDIIELHSGVTVPCDLVLLRGQCVLDESTLTGESVPIVKTSVPASASSVGPSSSSLYSLENSKNNTIYAGTRVLEVKSRPQADASAEEEELQSAASTGTAHVDTFAEHVQHQAALALVARTNFSTAKGQLILSILNPRPSKYKYYRDAYFFILSMFAFGITGFIPTLVRMIQLNVDAYTIIMRGISILTIVVPAALPIALSVGTTVAIQRMKTKNIFCTDPNKVNVGGRLDLMCWDKTGTLTEIGMTCQGVVPTTCREGEAVLFDELVSADQGIREEYFQKDNSVLYMLLASCHYLARVQSGELVGDPLEITVFESTRWILEDSQAHRVYVKSPDGARYIEVMKHFEFESGLYRMSVVVRDAGTGEYYAFCKGNPDLLVKSMCNVESIPVDFGKVLTSHSSKGHRVLGCGFRKLSNEEVADLQNVKRHHVEHSLYFLGLIILENKPKSDSAEVIRKLKEGGIRSVIITGDSALTAASIAKEVEIVEYSKRIFISELDTEGIDSSRVLWREHVTTGDADRSVFEAEEVLGMDASEIELVVTGPALPSLQHDPQNFSIWRRIMETCKVFARLQPDQKTSIIREFQSRKHIVGMCGDGANDVGALKAADVGMSLSIAEASIAAPFTCSKTSIDCMVTTLREGKASLATSFSLLKFMALYAILQSMAVLTLYFTLSYLGDWQYLYVDSIVVFSIVFLMPTMKARSKLLKQRPPETLFARYVFWSVLVQAIIAYAFYLLTWFDIRSQSWYRPYDTFPASWKNILCYETSALFLVSTLQTINVGIAYSIGSPYRRELVFTPFYFLALIVLYLLTIFVAAFPQPYAFADWIQVVEMPWQYKCQLIVYALIHLAVSWIVERFVFVPAVWTVLWKRLVARIKGQPAAATPQAEQSDEFRVNVV